MPKILKQRGRWLARLAFAALVLAAVTLQLSSCAMSRNGKSDVAVTLTEYTITMPNELPAGMTRFRILNAGTMEHNFEIKGTDVDQKLPNNLHPGDVEDLRVDLKAGIYQVFCPIADHKDRGMSLQLTVTTGSAQY